MVAVFLRIYLMSSESNSEEIRNSSNNSGAPQLQLLNSNKTNISSHDIF